MLSRSGVADVRKKYLAVPHAPGPSVASRGWTQSYLLCPVSLGSMFTDPNTVTAPFTAIDGVTISSDARAALGYTARDEHAEVLAVAGGTHGLRRYDFCICAEAASCPTPACQMNLPSVQPPQLQRPVSTRCRAGTNPSAVVKHASDASRHDPTVCDTVGTFGGAGMADAGLPPQEPRDGCEQGPRKRGRGRVMKVLKCAKCRRQGDKAPCGPSCTSWPEDHLGPFQVIIGSGRAAAVDLRLFGGRASGDPVALQGAYGIAGAAHRGGGRDELYHPLDPMGLWDMRRNGLAHRELHLIFHCRVVRVDRVQQ